MISHEIKTVYMMGIGGIAMGTLATMLSEKGFQVTGSDQNLYPPMSTHLQTLNIPVSLGYDAQNPQNCPSDLFVIGNVIRRDNPEAKYVLDQGLPYISMPQAISRFFLSRHRSIVVTGTHGKSTTSSLLTWVLDRAGMDPSAFIGAFLRDWGKSYRLGSGPHMVIEGDEYDTAFFDKGPKFLPYQPRIGIITSIEFDHADIFPDLETILESFKQFVRIIPHDGLLIVNADDPRCLAVSKECKGRVATYGWSEASDWRVRDMEYRSGEIRFTYRNPLSGKDEAVRSPLAGRHNVANTLSVIAAASAAGASSERVAEAISSFGGVTRRQEIVGKAGDILVLDDFAHHPTAVRETISALSLFYPGRRLIVAFEPRTNSSRRSVFQRDYAEAFDNADCICIKTPPGMESIPAAERLDVGRLVQDIQRRGKETHLLPDSDSLLGFLKAYASPGDLVVCMSNGSFDGLPRRLADAFASEDS
jgi:UDP-N-acetylmuramate: L-alanyl-gamma-D-glutamyl-meso-diaminopimelate ligase